MGGRLHLNGRISKSEFHKRINSKDTYFRFHINAAAVSENTMTMTNSEFPFHINSIKSVCDDQSKYVHKNCDLFHICIFIITWVSL